MSKHTDFITETVNLSSFRLFNPPLRSQPGTALVIEKGGEYKVLEGPTLGELRWSAATIYRVNVRQQSLEVSDRLPCKGDVSSFEAVISAIWHICEPDVFVKQGPDAEQRIREVIVDEGRRIGRTFEPELVGEAEDALTKGLRKLADDGEERARGLREVGLRIVTVSVRLTADEATRDHFGALTAFDRRKERAERFLVALEKGDRYLIAMHMEQHPGDIGAVADMMRRQRQDEFDRSIKQLQWMIDIDAVEGTQIGAQIDRSALRNLLARLQLGNSPALGPPEEAPKDNPIVLLAAEARANDVAGSSYCSEPPEVPKTLPPERAGQRR